MKLFIDLSDRDDINQVFSLVEKLTLEEGGDGATLVFSPTPDKMADMYEKYMKTVTGCPYDSRLYKFPLIREGRLFTDKSNENIYFADSNDKNEYADYMWENKFHIMGVY